MTSEEIAYDESLPPELKAQLRQKRFRRSVLKPVILRLIGDHQSCTIDDLLIGMYRCKGKVMTRRAMTAHIKDLKKRGFVDSAFRGVYQLTAEGHERYQEAASK